MLPVIAIVGRPNVGKSTLFNTLTQTRDAIVADVPGVTRDRQYGYGKLGPVQYVCIDTGGLVENPVGMDALMRIQTEHAIREADRLVFVADARAGLTPQDQFFARELRKSGKPVFLAVNKAEGLEAAIAAADFHQLGLGEPHAIAATHGYGCEDLMDVVLEGFEAPPSQEEEPDDGRIRIAIIGRPNVGKSTLINRLIGEERLLTGPDHRRLLPLSAMGGACLVLYADLAARYLWVPVELPVGAIMALVGGPYFLVVLWKRLP